ncbi:MAG TPA: dehydrogenase E1 component subunit alpha/beta [Cytophagaceae bacterium]|jgi:2-oxoisovalerate dehydrogenase E1 component
MDFNKKHYSNEILIHLYKELLKPRLIEEKMLILLRQGEISKWFSGIGQEAISIGVVCALEKDEYILPLHRNLGIFTGRQIPFSRLFAQFQGKLSGFTKGRDRSFHFGSKEHHIVGMISHLGPQLAVADGIALADKLSGKGKVTVVFSGDGGASEGDFHEALNVAAVWQLPVIFVIENNGYGLSTPSSEQFRFNSFCEKGPAYGMETLQIDGNNVLEVFDSISNLAESIRSNPRPILVEALTFRMRGHEEASGTKYVPQELFDKWVLKDPVENYESYLIKEKVITPETSKKIRDDIKKEIESGLEIAGKEPMPIANSEEQLADMYAATSFTPALPDLQKTSKKRYVDAISDGMRQSLELYPNLIIMGQDIAEYGGVFKITEGFVEAFGKQRIRNTPLCESAIVGAALGLSIQGYKSIVEMQFADFVTCAFNQIVNNLAKSHYRWGQHADVVIRMPAGGGVAAGPFHSQSNEAWFFHTPGLKIVYPSNPFDAKGLLNAAIADPNPVMYFEHKTLYRSISADIPDDYYTIEIGKGEIVQGGKDLSIITYGMGVHWAKEVCKDFGSHSIQIVDLRSLMPWDKDLVADAVRRTGKVLMLTEDTLVGSIASEISAWITENCFTYLDAPVFRVGSLETAIPFSPPLEKNFLAKDRLKIKIEELLQY